MARRRGKINSRGHLDHFNPDPQLTDDDIEAVRNLTKEST